MDWGFLMAVIAVSVAGIAAVVGLWMERDPNRPPKWAWSLSLLIVMTTIVTVATSWWDTIEDDRREEDAVERHNVEMKGADERQAALKNETDLLKQSAAESKVREEKMAEDIARMLVHLDAMAAESNNPALKAFVKTEVNSQSRGNENIVKKVAQRVKDAGGDPDAMLAKHLPKEELSRVVRNIEFKAPASMKSAMDKGAKGGRKPPVGGRQPATEAPKGGGKTPAARPGGRPGAKKPPTGGRPGAKKPPAGGRPGRP